MPNNTSASPFVVPNVRLFVAFRLLFNSRFYYPIFTILFLDFGLSLEQFAILNTVWAASIVLLEVPSGALADTIGRRNLVLSASVIMVAEMLLMCFAPIGQATVVFYLFLFNRILSGAAEAAASGADEALAYDSLKQDGDPEQWSRVLEMLMRWQSAAFMIAMILGAALYDHTLVNRTIVFFGGDFQLSQNIVMRIPLFLTLVLAIGAVLVSLRMKEIGFGSEVFTSKFTLSECHSTAKKAFAKTLAAGKWIFTMPMALSVIAAGFLFDHVIRMTLTLNSQYLRIIDIPEALFGVISAGLAFMGIFIPRLGRLLAEKKTEHFNYVLIGFIILIGLIGMRFFVPYSGVVPMALLYIGFSLTGYLISYYLNQIADSDKRATILSFKGLSFNLAYGGIGILYSGLVYSLRQKNPAAIGMDPSTYQDFLFVEAFQWFPGYFLIAFIVIGAYARHKLRNNV